MKYFFVEGTFNNPIPIGGIELDRAMKKHLKYLENFIDKEKILFTGPKENNEGIIFIIKAKSLDEVQKIVDQDSLSISKVQKYKIKEFNLKSCQPFMESWFE
ncbi:YciI family protein [uncultured Clostridium sp.]|uniref:YciI family protein n=1 Tax=uncultured Clostridium sp. TaxID=59620 RepID=UPI0025E408C8|nr:YciI family protein [uncultured Clostridium sp.]